MAYGFGATLGAGSTDKVATAYTGDNTLTTYFFAAFANGVGGGGFGRLMEKNSTHNFNIAGGGTTLQFGRGTSGTWTFPHSSSAWHLVALSMDTGSTSNDPAAYVDGAVVTVTETGAPSVFAADANPYTIGNRAANDRNWDGMIAEFALWNVLLSADEMIALTKGFSPPLVRPTSLVEYCPMVRDNISLKNAAPTVVAGAVNPHPRIIRAKRRGR